MIISEDQNNCTYQIRAYAPGSITINETAYPHSLIVGCQFLLAPWRPQTINEVTIDDLASIIALKPELILLGTGITFKKPPTNILEFLQEHKFKLEYMNTGSACRTYMALIAENRNIVAALINGTENG